MSILGERLAGARVLDLFAGSGALGLEALSRGAAHASFVELAPASLQALRANVEALGVADRVAVRRGDAMRYAAKLGPLEFDVALADPPYTVPYATRLVALFRQRPFAGCLAVEHPAALDPAGDETRRYGDVAITFCYPP